MRLRPLTRPSLGKSGDSANVRDDQFVEGVLALGSPESGDADDRPGNSLTLHRRTLGLRSG